MIPSIGESLPQVAVLVPCSNEERTVGTVVERFRTSLPSATIYVYDNSSRDRTREMAELAGAVVRGESRPGKGFVVRRMFSDIEADVYILVDGDDTYEPSTAPNMVSAILEERLDMVVASRMTGELGAYRPGHRLGNALFTNTVSLMFGVQLRDILSGYRAFSRRFVKSFPVSAGGFAIEAEMTIHALTLNVPTREIDSVYHGRPDGSVSKLRTYRDGLAILGTIFRLFRAERPLEFFAVIGSTLLASALILAYPVVADYLQTGLVRRFPTAILSTGLVLSGLLSYACGLILDTVTSGRRENKLLSYLREPALDPAAFQLGPQLVRSTGGSR